MEVATEVWEDLRQERQARSMSLEEIGEQTKIPGRHLVALEEGRLLELPGGIFRRGIVRGYLQALDLPAEPWMERFEACLAEMPAAHEAEDLTVFAEGVWRNRAVEPSRAEALRWPGVLAMMLTLLLFGWCVWRYAVRGRVVLQPMDRGGVAASSTGSQS